ncbi:hypothetical protein U9M48_023150 [Paspalum notatum var. saurae]|uniref:Uncharacterized protein n=1 Tax=Paspalum notatum var. saurae TaxID=547442 RepID=A0AAQ3WVM3_PASNO
MCLSPVVAPLLRSGAPIRSPLHCSAVFNGGWVALSPSSCVDFFFGGSVVNATTDSSGFSVGGAI